MLPNIDFNLPDVRLGGLEIIEIREGWLDGRPLLSVPHRHNFHELIYLSAGRDFHIVDMDEYQLMSNHILFIPKNSIHHYLPDKTARGWKLIFDEHFFSPKQHQFIKGMLLLMPSLGQKCFCPKEESLQTIKSMLDLLSQLKGFEQKQILMITILTYLEDQYKQNIKVQDDIFINFLHLLEKNLHKRHDVQFYAESLNTTKKSLVQSVKRSTGKTTSEYIQSRLLVESMCRLQDRGSNIKEVAYSLGFSDPFYFSRFFKQKSGMSPERYRMVGL